MPIADPPALPEAALEERFLAATGPGGQNVNKVATAVQLRLDVRQLGLSEDALARLRTLAGSRMTADGAILITARAHRTREANRTDARARLAALVAAARVRPAPRAKTRLNRVGKTQRLAGKAVRSAVKKWRGKVPLD